MLKPPRYYHLEYEPINNNWYNMNNTLYNELVILPTE